MGLLVLMAGSGRGLLDVYPMAGGFSLRQVKQSYRTCVTVRRSSDSAEIDIGFTGGELNTGQLLSFCEGGSGFVRRWYNVNGVDHAEQSTAALQPRIVNAGSLEVNEYGKPVIRFIDPTAIGQGSFLEFDPFYSASQSYVGYYSAYCLVSAGTSPQLIGSSPIDRGLLALHNASTRQIRVATIRTATTVANGSALTTGATYAFHVSANRNDLRAYLNKTEAADIDVADTDTNFSMPTKIYIGNTLIAGTVVSDICISELLCDLANEDNQLAIRSNVFDYWGAA